MSAQRGARSKLADVLADIKDSRQEEPAPTKRRHTVNYRALSGHTPRQTRSSTTTASVSEASTPITTNSLATPSTTRRILKLFDRSVDLSQFSDGPLYPVCRAWVQGSKAPKIEEQSSTYLPEDIVNLPEPKSKSEAIKKFKLSQNADVRIPQSVRDFKAPENVEKIIDESIASMQPEDCLSQNKERWRKVKNDWSEANRIQEWRYQESFKILNEAVSRL